jgi:triosephosphate isomerase
MKKIMIAGNWKMNKNLPEALGLVNSINTKLKVLNLPSSISVLVCPPFVDIAKVSDALSDSKIMVGAQNCYYEASGAFTGEVSLDMLKSVGCKYVIIGHSERRNIFGESNELINKKMHAVLSADVTPILCIGETLAERKAGNTFAILKEQLDKCFADVPIEHYINVVVAYEPIWAIGTGVSATPKEIAETHNWLRHYFVEKCGDFIAKDITLLYGGSLNDANAEETLSILNVDGGLIGGASLVAEKFLSIIDTAKKLTSSIPPPPPCSCGMC